MLGGGGVKVLVAGPLKRDLLLLRQPFARFGSATLSANNGPIPGGILVRRTPAWAPAGDVSVFIKVGIS